MSHSVVVSRTLIPSLSKIEDSRERDGYWRQMCKLWGCSETSKRFPGCNPMSLPRARLVELATRRYGIALKSDGVRYALFLTVRPDGGAVALMVDRSRNFYEVEVVASADYFERGTILEGELVWRQPQARQMLFLIFDAVCLKGESLVQVGFEERLRRAHAATRWSEEMEHSDVEQRVGETDSIALVHFKPSIVLRPKHVVDRQHAVRLWADRHESEHRVDGLILFDLDAPYHLGTTENGAAFKWKESATVDLRDRRAADAPLPGTIGKRTIHIEENRVSEGLVKGTILEYHIRVDARTVTLVPLRTRPDKATANGLRVVTATIQDVLDDITVDELCGPMT